MAMGLIAAALGGAGKALSSIGEMEAKKQNEAKLRKELMDMESEERLRLDEVMFQRKQERAIPEAQTAARADVAGRSTRIDEENKVELPKREVAQSVAKDKMLVEEQLKQDTPKLNAELKVKTRLAELAASKYNKLDEEESRAKYNALMTDIRIAKELGADVAEAERAAEKENARISALIKNRVPANQAKLAGETKLENLRVESEKEMIDAEADLLLKKWNAAKGQRDAAAIEKVQNEIKEFTTKAGDPKYRDAVRKLALAGYVRPSSGTKESGGRTTITELKTKLTVAEDRLATELGVPRTKINEATLLLKKKADRGDAAAAKKLKDIQSYRDDVTRAQENISRWKDTDADKSDRAGESGPRKKPLSSFGQ